MIIKTLEKNEIVDIAILEENIFLCNSYTNDELLNFSKNENFFFVIEKFMEEIIGYAICFESIDTIEIYKIAIIKQFRNKKIGSKILEQIKSKNKKILIEVSDKDNLVNFYLKNGFKQIHFRKQYYSDKSNAIIMQWH